MLQLIVENPEFLVAILVAIVAALGFGTVLYAARWVRQHRMESRAQHWTRVDATVYGSYEIDESGTGVSASTWINLLDKESGDDYVSRWAAALQYSYSVEGKVYVGMYFLPETWPDSQLAAQAGKSWIGRKIVVRCRQERPEQSLFLVEDGAPGKPHIPASFAQEPYITNLSLK